MRCICFAFSTRFPFQSPPVTASHSHTTEPPGNWYARIPLYLKIVVALILGILLRPGAGSQGRSFAALRDGGAATARAAGDAARVHRGDSCDRKGAGRWAICGQARVAVDQQYYRCDSHWAGGCQCHSAGHAYASSRAWRYHRRRHNAQQQLLEKLPRNFIDPSRRTTFCR